ncbi:hypothetical protein [Ectobacillus funiculus]|uniref:Transposase n=1 Tax=Ectobacillus funiculus TaxID=137993 RepID=A0ABV5W9K5_9BACI|nr:hypothetical protein [Ectobacillus funiculus]
MIFSEWDEAFSHQDPQTETEAVSQQPINDNNILLLLDIAKQLDKCIKSLEAEYGAKATKLAEIPFNQLIDYIFNICKITPSINTRNINLSK